MTTISADRDLLSIGMLASHVRRSVQAIEKTASEIGAAPAMKINGTVYFDGEGVAKITQAFNSPGGKS